MTKSSAYRIYGKGTVSNALRQKIRKAQLRVTLDKELGRETSPEVKKLAALPLPPITRVNRTSPHQVVAGAKSMSRD